jgi:hypothetical protein
MKKLVLGMTFVAGVVAAAGSSLFACGSNDESEFDGGRGDSGGIGTLPPDGDGGGLGSGDDGGGGLKVTQGDSGVPCEGLQCSIVTTCGDGGTTTITGQVLDPAGTEPIYNAVVYVPMYDPANPSVIPSGAAIQPIQGGVAFPSGVTCDSCSYLFTGNPIAVGSSGPDGTFTITGAPSGKNIPVVVQIGKWRTHTTVTVPSCGTASAGAIKLPSKIDPADTIQSMPQFALSMGDADSLECLLYRIGIDLSEFTAGPSASGHVHLFTGAQMRTTSDANSPPPAPYGYEQMWDSLADLKKYDVSVFSCEGQETTNANPQILHDYVNAGGRAFLSHFHYSWITGAIETVGGNKTLAGNVPYTANADWQNLASWNTADPGVSQTSRIGVKVDSTLIGNDAGPFLKGQILTQWLTYAHAFSTDGGVPSDEVPIVSPAFDPSIGPTNTQSQEYAHYDPSTYVGDSNANASLASYPSAYFSFNTPVDAVSADGGAAPYCGRVVFSGLHIGAAAQDKTTTYNALYPTALPSASTCNPAPGNLSPQEKILEFILFDLSSCVTPDTAAPAPPISIIR